MKYMLFSKRLIWNENSIFFDKTIFEILIFVCLNRLWEFNFINSFWICNLRFFPFFVLSKNGEYNKLHQNLTLRKSVKRYPKKTSQKPKWKTDRDHHCQQIQEKQIENRIAKRKKTKGKSTFLQTERKNTEI